MWSGHSCPPPLTLVLQLILEIEINSKSAPQDQLQDQKRRTRVSAPHNLRMLLFFFPRKFPSCLRI